MSVKIKYLGHPILKDVIERRKTLRRAVEDATFVNRQNLMSIIGDEIIQGFRGGVSVNINTIKVNDNHTISYAREIPMPYGILKGRSPNGKEYKPLSGATIALKKRHNSKYATRPLIDHGFMLNGLRKQLGEGAVAVDFADPASDEISAFHEKGGRIRSTLKGRKGYADVPARPNRDMQERVSKVINALFESWSRFLDGKTI